MSAKNNKILEDVHPLTIINEVQKWPVLYSRESRERGNVYFKTKVWYEVAKSVFADWDSYTDTEKESKVIDLNKRWRNLRDTFKRQVELEKKASQGKETKKKTYVYFKHMLFLLPHVTSVEDTNVINPKLVAYFQNEKNTKRKIEQHHIDETPLKEKTKKVEERNTKRNIEQQHIDETPLKKKTKKVEERRTKRKIEQHFIDETPISIPRTSLKTYETDEIDEDRHFALSLIPTLKKMTDDEKLMAKMEILKVLRKVRSQRTREKAQDLVCCVEEVDSSDTVKIEFLEDAGEETTNMSGESENSE